MRYVQVGLGYRVRALRKVLADLGGFECVGLVLRKVRTANVPVYTDLDRCLDEVRAEIVFDLAPVRSAAQTATIAVGHGVPVMTEAPAGATTAELERLGELAGSGLVQIAERDPLMPGHAARLAAVRLGMIGEVSQVQVSSAQPCHAMALIRAYLGVGVVPAVVRGHRFSTALADPRAPGRANPAGEDILASVDFGEGRSGIYDSSDNEARTLLQAGRLLVRGSHGEISGDQVVLLSEHNLITTTYMRRQHDPDTRSTSQITLGEQVLWANPWPEMGWSDDEVAAAEFLTRTASWMRGEAAAPYPLAEALLDARLGLAIGQAIKQDRTVEVPA